MLEHIPVDNLTNWTRHFNRKIEDIKLERGDSAGRENRNKVNTYLKFAENLQKLYIYKKEEINTY